MYAEQAPSIDRVMTINRNNQYNYVSDISKSMVACGHPEKNGCPEVILHKKHNINLEFGIGTQE